MNKPKQTQIRAREDGLILERHLADQLAGNAIPTMLEVLKFTSRKDDRKHIIEAISAAACAVYYWR